MNRRQFFTILAVILFISVGLYPPWKMVIDNKTEQALGHHWIFEPPRQPNFRYGAKVDATRLIIYWAVIIISFGLLASGGKAREKNPANEMTDMVNQIKSTGKVNQAQNKEGGWRSVAVDLTKLILVIIAIFLAIFLVVLVLVPVFEL